MDISRFDFTLPDELIALEPMEERSSSKLLHLDSSKNLTDKNFKEIIDLIKPNDVLVFNDTKVIKARVTGVINDGKVEITLIKKLISQSNKSKESIWQVLAKPGKKFRLGSIFKIKDKISAEVVDKNEDGVITLKFNKGDSELLSVLEKEGSMPLPPYIEKKRKADSSDDSRYQTVFAKKEGAVAAPTAGLHFTDEILNMLEDNGVKITYITLHVGAGTFLPVRVDDIKNHKMHSEYFEIPQETAQIINNVKNNGGRVIAVGTTSLRALEACLQKRDKLEEAYEETDIFIYPGYEFKIVDCLITNFHLPKSTLFMLVSAFSGLDNIQKLYQHAVDKEYRFFSYGDSCFLERLSDMDSTLR